FETLEFIGYGVPGPLPGALPPVIELRAQGTEPRGMLKAPAGPLQLILTGYDYNNAIPSGEFPLDKFEVTNTQYKDVVDSGGYESRTYWNHQFAQGGRTLTWEGGIAKFRDQTGRPGPSTWEVGTYRQGEDDYPVAGVSWFEAAAYAEFRGRSLPTVYHWIR